MPSYQEKIDWLNANKQVFWFKRSQAKPTSLTLGKYNHTVG
jgi:hypothetical protein